VRRQLDDRHKGNGVAAIYAKFKLTDDVVQAGMPNITAVIEGRDEILDPRDGSTATPQRRAGLLRLDADSARGGRLSALTTTRSR
jgi:hypothetical protein